MRDCAYLTLPATPTRARAMSADPNAGAVLDEPDPGTAPTLPAAAAATTASGLALSNPWSQTAQASDTLLADAAATDAWAQLSRCFPGWPYARSNMRTSALKRLAANRPVDPNDRLTWRSADAHVTSVLRRHGLHVKASDLADRAAWALVDGQRKADEDAGLDWLTLHDPVSVIDEPLAKANSVLPIDLADPAAWWHPATQRKVLAQRLGVDVGVAEELSHWALANASSFEADSLRSWRIASPTWLRLADEQLGPVGTVDRPVGVFIAPSSNAKGWCLQPVLSLPMIRLIAELGGGIDRTLQIATIPGDVAAQLLRRMNTNTLHSGDRAIAEQSTEIARLLGEIFGQAVRVSLSQDTRDRWGRLHVSEYSRAKADSQIQLMLMTTTVKDFSVKRLGAARLNHQNSTSVVMELGEAVNCAVDRGLPLLLSSEAAGTLNGTVRVGRMRGRPGMVTITSSDGVEAKTSRLMAEQAVLPLRELRDSGAEVILDAGALQVMRMVLAKPLSDDPVLLGRQCDVAAKMTVGSGVQASQTGHRQDRRQRPRSDLPPRRGRQAPREDRAEAGALARGRGRRRTAARAMAQRAHRRVAGARDAAAGTEREDRDGQRPQLGRRAGPRVSPRAAATSPACCSFPTACSIATRTTSWSSTGTCSSPTRRCATPTPPPRRTRRCGRSASARSPTAGF